MSEPGDCYEAAATYVLEHPQTILVHGQPYLTRAPYTQFGHAWVETNGLVIDVANGHHVELPVDVYYALGRINPQTCYRYQAPEVRDAIVSTGHWGPWEKKRTDEGRKSSRANGEKAGGEKNEQRILS